MWCCPGNPAQHSLGEPPWEQPGTCLNWKVKPLATSVSSVSLSWMDWLLFFTWSGTSLSKIYFWKLPSKVTAKCYYIDFNRLQKKKAIFLKNIRDFWPLKNKIVDTLSCHFSLWTWKTCLPTMVYWTPGSYRVISLSRYWCFRNEIKDWLFSLSLCFAEDAHVLYWPY